jgi:hypothetical protein
MADAVPLVWAHNVGPGQLTFHNRPGKPQYVVSRQPLCGPAIVVNRIVGAVGSGQLRAALVPEGMRFVGENHVNVIRPRAGIGLTGSWAEVLEALLHRDVAERIRLLTGNSQVSATELTHLLPLDL